MQTKKGEGGPNRHHEAHQIPLKNPKTDTDELEQLEEWLRSYQPEVVLADIAGKETSND